jgi:hypothetical protein
MNVFRQGMGLDWAEIRKPAELAGSSVSISILVDWEKFSATGGKDQGTVRLGSGNLR